ncbi:hypothetical protein [Sphingobacterium sp. ML3W]|uniref:hypothetical protein n=1 Tax=Sphingobacterium sp. ML3W TaxID=1538644 RepID=UPI00130DC1DB|nr:hypothetical protein [Sphingobacterium sp. ML3W]
MFIIDIRWIFKILFNLAIIIIIGRLFYAPYEPKLQGTNLVYILPCIGLLSSYLYLAVWFGWKKGFKILCYVAGYFLFTGYFALRDSLPKWLDYTITVAILSLIGYGCYRIIKFLINLVKNLKMRFEAYRMRNKNRR